MRCLLFLVVIAFASATDNPLRQVNENPKLPRVLLIGDSISMGCTLPLRDKLKETANVQHAPENCGASRRIVGRIEHYLGKRPWDVIVFNCGIHDLTHLDKAKKAADPEQGGQLQVPLDEYRENLEKIVTRLKKTNAKLIWCTTTPVTVAARYRKLEDVFRYNSVGSDVMRRHRIPIVDLHSKDEKGRSPELSPDGVHFTLQGYRDLARRIVPAIEDSLAGARGNTPSGSEK